MAGYVIADVDVHDMDALDEYHKIAGPSLEKYGGRVKVGAGPFEVMEGSWSPHRVVVMEFESVERAREWYASDEFAPALAIRLKAATTDLIIVDGV